MAPTKKTSEELQELVAKGATAVKNARDQVAELQTQVTNFQTEKQAHDAQIEAAKALGPEIVDRLIQTGRYSESKRAAALEAMGDPVKVAQELGNILAIKTDVPTVGTPDGEPGEKLATGDENPMQKVDDRYRQEVGLT